MKDWEHDYQYFVDHAASRTYVASWFTDKGGIQRSGTHVQIGKFGCDMFQRGYEEGRQDAVIKEKELMRKIEELEKTVF